MIFPSSFNLWQLSNGTHAFVFRCEAKSGEPPTEVPAPQSRQRRAPARRHWRDANRGCAKGHERAVGRQDLADTLVQGGA